jgi:predicted HAD superfamily Cof-like phosphohydrolase
MGQTNFDDVNAELQILAQEGADQRMMDAYESVLMEELARGEYGYGDWVDDIHLMHTKFGVRKVVAQFGPEKLLQFLDFRLKFLQEELNEARTAYDKLVALQNSEVPDRNEQAVQAADDVVDSMIDLCVVAIGTLDAYCVDSHLAWSRVMKANLAKEPGIKPERPNPLGLPDLIKPAGWVGPTHEDNIGLLERL